MGTRVGPPKWKAEGIRIGRPGTRLPGGKRTPASAGSAHLGKELAGYIMRAEAEL